MNSTVNRWLIFCVAVICVAVGHALEAVQTFRIEAVYPRSLSSLFLRGNEAACGLNWSSGKKMVSSIVENFKGSGQRAYVWSIDLTCSGLPTSSMIEVKVLVDDNRWMIGANHHISMSSLAANASVDQMFPYFYTTVGSLTTISKVYSKELNNFRDVIFYLPPSYNENTLKSYRNVLIMHDGQNLFDPKTSSFGTAWMCQDTLNAMIVQGLSDEVIIAGPYNTNDRNNEYTYVYDPSEGCGGKGDLYLDWIESTLIPLVQKSFRVNMQRDTLGILGSSLGGLISCYAGYTRAPIYGKIGCMSSSFWWDDNDFQKNIIVNKDIDRSQSLPVVYMDSGTVGGEQSCMVYTSQIDDYLKSARGFEESVNIWEFVDRGGAHNEASWGNRFDVPIGHLYPPSSV